MFEDYPLATAYTLKQKIALQTIIILYHIKYYIRYPCQRILHVYIILKLRL